MNYVAEGFCIVVEKRDLIIIILGSFCSSRRSEMIVALGLFFEYKSKEAFVCSE